MAGDGARSLGNCSIQGLMIVSALLSKLVPGDQVLKHKGKVSVLSEERERTGHGQHAAGAEL